MKFLIDQSIGNNQDYKENYKNLIDSYNFTNGIPKV